MSYHTMSGLMSAKSLTRSELLRVIDRFDLKDYTSNTLIAPLWSSISACPILTVNCRDPEPALGCHLLSQLPEILLEGLLIAEHILAPNSLSLILPEGCDLPEAFRQIRNITVSAQASPHGLCHGVETFVALARLFRREGAEKRICRISAPGMPTAYYELPITVSFREITHMLKLTSVSGAVVGGDDKDCISLQQFDSIPRLTSHASIAFF